MYFPKKEFNLKDGRTCIFRSVTADDAELLLNYLKGTAKETPFLLHEPEEVDEMTIEEERRFLQNRANDPRQLMLLAFVDGEFAGNCGLLPFGGALRTHHRCGMAIALYQKFCGLGLGRKLIETVCDVARKLGYEQMELEVVEGNDRARHLYESLGFVPFGVRPHALKYKDGTYADEIMMVKAL